MRDLITIARAKPDAITYGSPGNGSQPDVQQRFASEGGDVAANTPDEFGAFIRREIAKWSEVIKDAGAKVD